MMPWPGGWEPGPLVSPAPDTVHPLAVADRTRTALLAAVSHDLRTPLAAAKAAVSCLRSRDIELTAADHDDLSRGLIEAMRGTLVPEETPGGGLTMTLSIPAAPSPTRRRLRCEASHKHAA